MKKLVLLLLCTLAILSSCERSSVSEGRKLYKLYFRKALIDPDSFKVYDEAYKMVDAYEIDWAIDYGARNGGGAMTRHTVQFKTFGDRYIYIDGESYEKKDLERLTVKSNDDEVIELSDDELKQIYGD